MPENKTVLIWDADSGEMPEHDVLVTWNSYQEDVANNKISIPHNFQFCTQINFQE